MKNLNLKCQINIKILIALSFVFPLMLLAETPPKVCLKGLCLGDSFSKWDSELKPLKPYYYSKPQKNEKCKNKIELSYGSEFDRLLVVKVELKDNKVDTEILNVKYRKLSPIDKESSFYKIAFAISDNIIDKYGNPSHSSKLVDGLDLKDITYNYNNNIREISIYGASKLYGSKNQLVYVEEIKFKNEKDLDRKYSQCMSSKYID